MREKKRFQVLVKNIERSHQEKKIKRCLNKKKSWKDKAHTWWKNIKKYGC